jgi:CRP/FNR family transcriptional regulator, anaerobic regulatory protein
MDELSLDDVFRLLDSYAELERGLREFLVNTLKPIKFKTGEIIVEEETTARYVGFITKGIIRSYRFDENRNEHTSWIMMEGDVCAAIHSLLTQTPATETVIAIAPTTMYCLYAEKLQFALKTWPSFHLHRAELLQKYYLQNLEREALRQKTNAYDRFCLLMEQYPRFKKRVRDKYLASFISITPQHYSTLKKQYKKDHPVAS